MGLDWDEFKVERRDEAIDLILDYDSILVLDAVINHTVGSDENAEYAFDVMVMALSTLLAQRDKGLDKDKAKITESVFEKTLLEAPFFEDLIEFKLNEMWDMGI